MRHPVTRKVHTLSVSLDGANGFGVRTTDGVPKLSLETVDMPYTVTGIGILIGPSDN